MFFSFDLCVCERQREKGGAPLCVRVCVCVSKCVCEPLCVYERKRERESELTAIVCVCERASVCVSDCVCVSECVWE